MFSTTKLISIFSIILAVINILGVLMAGLLLLTYELGFAVEFCILLYLVTSTVGSLLITISLRSLCQDLLLNHESTSHKLRELENKCKTLENNI